MVSCLFRMATNSGFQLLDQGPKDRLKWLCREQRMESRENEDDLEVLVVTMAQLSLAGKHPRPLPIWGQIKSLTANG